ncbi:30S ribosome-binding factor RbfA [candidate division WOR-3 bacterium]|nr:30S ribosome-binding factor RbfA [candidate division WOR-3 bacterium]
MNKRDKRVADAVKETVAEIVLNEVADPGIGFVTVTRCHVTRDLRVATVYFSAMGDEKQQEKSFAHLEHARGYVRRRLGERVRLRYLPELRFRRDDVLAQEMRISEIISDLHRSETDASEESDSSSRAADVPEDPA